MPPNLNNLPQNSNTKKEVAYELHKPSRLRYPRWHVTTLSYRDEFQADLIFMPAYAKMNRNYKYLLTVIRCFSKFAWARALKSKKSAEVAAAMQSIFESKEKQFLLPPRYLCVDRGGEFPGNPLKIRWNVSK